MMQTGKGGGALIHEVLAVGPLQCNCSILGDPATRESIVVDPGDEIADVLAVVERHQLTVKWIAITHAHIDHVGGAQKLKSLTGAPVYMSEADVMLYDNLEWQARWLGMRTPERGEIDTWARDGDLLRAGQLEFRVLATPGHTEGSLCLWMAPEGRLMAGDTLFRDSIGRTDLPGGDHKKILRSIGERLLVLPEDTLVIPGHGPSTTIGREKESNPFVRGFLW